MLLSLFRTLPLSLTSSLLRLLLLLIIIVYYCCCLFSSHSLSHSLTLALSSVFFFFLLLFPLTLSPLVLIILSLSFSLQATEEDGEGATEEAAGGMEQSGMALAEVRISRARSLSLVFALSLVFVSVLSCPFDCLFIMPLNAPDQSLLFDEKGLARKSISMD